jgi:hypothetical protein
MTICQEIKCKDCLTDEGDPAWCFRAGQSAEVAIVKCPRAPDEKREEKQDGGNGKKI